MANRLDGAGSRREGHPVTLSASRPRRFPNHVPATGDRCTYLTPEAYERLSGELHELKTTGRERVSQAIGVAREHGDIRENADYDAAKNEQGMMEARIRQLEEILRSAVVGAPRDTGK